MNKDRIGGLIFLVLSMAYGYSATFIPALPGEEMEPLTPRSFPYALAFFGCLFSLFLILKSGVQQDDHAAFNWQQYDWKLTGSLLLLMLVYGFLLSPLGFLVATLLFLIAGYYLMGERSIKVLLLASVPLVFVFWILLSKILGVYLEAGTLWG